MLKAVLISLNPSSDIYGCLRSKGFPLFFILLAMFLLYACTEKSAPPYPQSSAEGTDHSPANMDGSIEKLREAARKEPEDLNIRIMLGNLLMDAGRLEEAIEVYEEILKTSPENSDVRVDLGTCYRNSGDPERAAAEYQKALRYDPGNPHAHRNLGIVLAYDLGRIEEAITELETYLRISPDVPDAEQVRQAIKELRERS
ncbi:MAG: tetratricopeptide repeat protein [Nitrospirae bacterium]|nr:tetratricopeptide repeat protein [Nitrospirota bacterium]